MLEAHLDYPAALLPGDLNYTKAAANILPFLEVRELTTQGETLFAPGEPCDKFYIIQTGEVPCKVDFADWAGTAQGPMAAQQPKINRLRKQPVVQFVVYGPGGVFFLRQPYTVRAQCCSAPCR